MKPSIWLLSLSLCMLVSCGTPEPREYFAQAVLNCNLLFGFADRGLYSQLESPSEKLVDQRTMATEPMLREEVVTDKLEQIEANFEKVKRLPANEDANDMVKSSIALYEFVLPVYKNEIMLLAKKYDDKAPAEDIQAEQRMISDTYADRFNTLYQAVIDAGLAYAGRNGIPVQTASPTPPRRS